MTKKLNSTDIISDLEGSAFFPSKKPAPPVATPPTTVKPESSHKTKPSVAKNKPVPLVPPVRGVPPPKRKMKQRHPFDIYQDQLDELRKLALEERMQGGVGSMSAMVREAIDGLIAKKRNK
jgi:hypothetical protein